MIIEALPQAEEAMRPNGFALHTIDGEWIAGFATGKKGLMFYCMVQSVIDEHSRRLDKIRSGKSCIDFRSSMTISLDDLRQVARDILTEVANRRHRNGEVE